MRFEESRVGAVLVAKVLDARIAADGAPRLKDCLAGYIVRGNRSIVLDLADVTFIDSGGLGALISILKSLGKDGELVISGARSAVAGMFRLTRMDQVFQMFESNELAVAALS